MTRLADVDVVVHHRTERALLVSTDGDVDAAVWVPLSAVEFEPSRGDPRRGTLTLPEELAVEKRLV